MDGSRRPKGRLRDVHPEDEDEGVDSSQVASSSRIPAPPSQLPPKRLGVPPPPSFGPPSAAKRSTSKLAFEAGEAPGQAPRRKRKGKRQRATPLLGKTKAPTGLESDSSEEPEEDSSKVQETGFFQTLWQGATAAIGVVRYVSQFCLYLGIDVAAEPDLITEVDDYLKRPLPEGWSTHQTGEDCEYGAGYTYFMNASTGKTQWTRPDEDEFLQHLRSKMKRKPTAGSRLFFAEFRDRNRREKWAALEDQIDHLSGMRPLLRALPEGSAEPAHASSSIFHVVLYNRFPVLYPAVVEGFASYFGLGSVAQFAAAELRHFWVAKAVFVDQGAGTVLLAYPLNIFVYWKGFCQDIGVSRPTEPTEPEEKIFPTAAGNAKKQTRAAYSFAAGARAARAVGCMWTPCAMRLEESAEMVPHSDLAPPEPPMGPATPKAPPTPKQEVEGKETPRQEAAESGESDPDAGEKETPEEEESTLLHPEADSGEADAAVAAAAAAAEAAAEAAEAAEAAPSPEAAVSSKEAEKTLLPEAPEAEALAETVDQPQLEEDESTLPQPEAEPVEAADAASPMEEAVSAEASPTPVPEHAEPAEPSVEATSAEGPTEEAPAEVPEVPSSPRSSSLFSLAEQLQLQQGDEPRRIVEILEELERIPVTVELLRQTQLGVISQPFKDHDDADVRKVAKRLRRSWKDLIAATAEANEAPMPPAEEVSMPDTAVAPEAQHGMVPPEKEEELTVEEEADKLLKEMEEINTKMDSPKLQRKVGGTEDATELFGSTPREPQLEHVGAPKHLFRPSSASSAAPRRHSAVQDADEVFGKSPRDGAWETPEHVGAPKHLLRPTSAQARRPSLEEVLSGSAPPAKGTFARAATLSLNPLPPTPLPSTAAPPPPKQLPKAPAPPKQLPAAKQAPQLPAPKALPAMPAKAEKVLPKAEAEMEQKVSEAAPAPEPPTVGELAPEPPKVAEAPTTPPKVSEPSPVQSAQPAEPAVSMAPRVMALLPPAPLPPAPAPAPASAPPPPPKTGSPSRKKPSMAPLPPVPEIEQAQAEQEASSESSEELLPETPVAKHAAQAAPAPPTAAGYPKMAEAPAAPGGGAGYPQGELPARPQPQMNAGLPSAARRQRAELVSNLQYLCRLFLETREQLYAAHEGTETEAIDSIPTGRDLTSPELPERLQTQSIVEELEVVGTRFHYQLQRGRGPNSGWISSKLKGRPLLVRADVRDTGKHLGNNAPIPELLYVQGSEKHGTLREVQGTLDDLEQGVLKHLEGNPSAASKQFQGLLEDMLFLAWRRENRQRVLLFLGKQLEFCSKKPQLKEAARIICEELCLVSWASSMVDVEYYSFRDEQSPLVLLCGFGGSHLDDLQPAIEHWTEKGFGVLAFGPARLGREDMLDLIHAKLLELSRGRSVFVHLFSDGGFGFARALLSMWDESWRKQQTQEDPHLALKCIICDGAGLLPHEDVPIDPTDESPVEPLQPEATGNSEALKQMTFTALAFFTGCGLNMLMNFGACQAFHEEPANSFGKTLVESANSGQLAGKLSSAPRGPLLGIWRLLREVPVLLIASKGDRVVPLERSLSLVTWFRKLPERQLVQGQRWKETSILEEDGMAVHTLILEKALHCKAMTSHAVEYWEAVDDLANCDGLREELDAVRFRRLLEETLGQSHGAMPKPLIRLLRSFGRRALYGRRRSPYGRRAFAQFQQACTGQGPKGFVLGAVPQILRLMDRLVDEGRRTMPDAVEDGGDDPWLDGMPEETEKGRGLPDWEKLDGILSEPQNLESLQAEADAFLAETSMPKPLCLSKAERAETTAEPPDSGSFAPRGRRPATAVPGDDGADAKQGRRLFASVGPYYSCDPELLLKVAKAPLPNLDTLVRFLRGDRIRVVSMGTCDGQRDFSMTFSSRI
ncbi:unnamed protein product [Cladocopium goreaui]|uniref:SET domain-containing protein 2 n=1 Tax=Cladocopium goreaui TaxID=2562237 RepID=A0A9P1GJG8_9DINO|nr:unnamed protein product [Cladocopium goreaui]